MGWPAGYYLWCWENPYPERPVEQLEFIPRGGRFVVVGITTSNLDEYPFVRESARPVRLVTKDGRNGVFDIEVDRGVATYPQPLPGEDDRAGLGATEGTAAHASITALPSATVAVRRGGDELRRAGRSGRDRPSRRRRDAGPFRRRDARILPVPEQRLPAAARRWHGQDVQRRTGRQVFAHTSPVYVACGGGDWTMTDPEGIRYIRTLVEGARDYVRHTAVRRSDQLTTHHHGEADHLAWLERPFTEALRALEERGRA
jgi:hypothetical protein